MFGNSVIVITKLSELVTLGVARVGMFSDVTRWDQVTSVWSRDRHDTRLVTLLTFLDKNGQCLVTVDGEERVLVMFPHSTTTGIIGALNTIDSHFYIRQLTNKSIAQHVLSKYK